MAASAAVMFTAVQCAEKEQAEVGGGITNVNNPWAGDVVNSSGETVSISFDAAAAWTAEIKLSDDGEWAEIGSMTNNTAAGRGSVRIYVEANTGEARTISVYVTVDGYPQTLLCELTQAAGDAVLNESLNTAMHNYLKENYLWSDDYNRLDQNGEIDLSAAYQNFLYDNLTKLGNVNIEDGGIYREYSVNSGQRYIYSRIDPSGSSVSGMSLTKAPVTKLALDMGLGIGPCNSIRWESGSDVVVLVIGYIYPGSPAEEAGLKRGDMINSVNGVKITMSNYSLYQQELFYTTSGSYELGYIRQQPVLNDAGQPMYDESGNYQIETLNLSAKVAAGSYYYNPVLFNSVIGLTPKNGGGTHWIGYMALESFDLSAQTYLADALKQLHDNNVQDLVLDLRFCVGGNVEQCRYLMTSIVGTSNLEKTFAILEFNRGMDDVETWTFGDGSDNPAAASSLGVGPDLGLERLFVICSENTASAAEMVIASLEGIDFPVYTFGSKTEGKNVGMTTSVIYNSSKTQSFEFAPITFRVHNAKGYSDYADGMDPDFMVNNQDGVSNASDDIDYIFPYDPNDWQWWFRDYAVSWATSWIVDGENPEWVETWYEQNGHGEPPVIKSSVRNPGPLFTPETYSAVTGVAVKGGAVVPDNAVSLGSTPVKLVSGRYGAVVNTTNEIILPGAGSGSEEEL